MWMTVICCMIRKNWWLSWEPEEIRRIASISIDDSESQSTASLGYSRSRCFPANRTQNRIKCSIVLISHESAKTVTGRKHFKIFQKCLNYGNDALILWIRMVSSSITGPHRQLQASQWPCPSVATDAATAAAAFKAARFSLILDSALFLVGARRPAQ